MRGWGGGCYREYEDEGGDCDEDGESVDLWLLHMVLILQILNMISTGVMIRVGKTHGNLVSGLVVLKKFINQLDMVDG